MPSLTFAYPGDLQLKTGGYGYDRKVIAGLRDLGWDVSLLPLGPDFPAPSAAVLDDAEARLSALPDNTLVMIDGLAFGILDDWAERDAERLCIIALVHHPLALEGGQTPERQDALAASERKALSFARHVVVTSPPTARELVANFGVPDARLTVALPGTDPAPLSPCDGAPPHILSIGTLIPRKAHDVLIEALSLVADCDWTATIVGSKALHPETAKALAAQITRLDLEDRIALVGEQDDTRALLAKADLFALASRYEGYGMVFAEALSQGVPIVACHAGAIPQVVPAEAGLLVPPDDVAAFAAALRWLLEDKAQHRQMANAARKAGAQLPSWDDTTRIVAGKLEAMR